MLLGLVQRDINQVMNRSRSHRYRMDSPIVTPSEDLFQSFIRWRRGEVYMMERTGEMGEPCGTPTGCPLTSLKILLNFSCALLSRRNSDIHPVTLGLNPSCQTRLMRRPWFTLSKNPWMSKRRMAHLRPAAWVVWMFRCCVGG